MKLKYWYVHDEADCFDKFETVEAAAATAKHLAEVEEMDGVHIVHMTETQAAVYAQTGDLVKALKAE